MSNHDNSQRAKAADDPPLSAKFDRNAFDGSTTWMIHEVGANSDARSIHDALRMREGEVLEQWRSSLGDCSKAELVGLVRTAHLIRDALRPEQVGDQQRPS